MRVAEEFRSIAREVLKGKWKIAVLVGLVAALLGGVGGSGLEVEYHMDESTSNVNFSIGGQTIFSTGGEMGVDINTDYYGAAEPPVRCGVSHLSGLTEPLL